MRVLVAGAAGLLGRAIVKLLSREHEVYALIREKQQVQWGGPVQEIACDLSSFSPLELPSGINAVYYLAQSKRFREFPGGAADMLEVNVRAPLKLVEWARTTGVHSFVYTSTGGVYGSGPLPCSESAQIYATPTKGFYANSKLSAELLLSSFAEFFERFVIVRPFFIYGPAQDRMMLVPRLLRTVAEGGTISLAGEEGIRINPVHVEDAAIACGNIFGLDCGSYVFNIGGIETVSIRSLGIMMGNLLGREPLFSVTGAQADDLVGDISLMRQLLHTPGIDLATGLGLMTGAV